MVRFSVILLIVQTFWAIEISTITAQHSSSSENSLEHNRYSLQPAIDALRHRATKLALRDYENAHHEFNDGPKYISNSLVGYDSNEPNLKKQHQINRILAKFLDKKQEEEEEEQVNEQNDPYYDDDDDFYEERKRSIFRERGADEDLAPYPSVFRERGYEANADNTNYNDPNNYALAQEFLREIGQEREKQYRENLAHLLKKYEQEEEEALEREALADEIRQNRLVAEKRRLILPWMPASRRKRFPISKRSPVPIAHAESITSSGTNEKVARDLQAIFGHPDRKLTAEVEQPQLQVHSDEQILHHKIQKKSDRVQDLQDQSQHHDDSQFRKELEQQIQADHSGHIHTDHDDHEDSEAESHEESVDEKFLEHDHNHEKHLRKELEHVIDDVDEDSKEEDNSKEDESEDESDRKNKTKRSTTETTTATAADPSSIIITTTTASSTTAVPVSNATKITHNSNKEYVRDFHNNKASSVERISSRRKKSIEWSKYFGLDRKKKSVDDWFMSKHKSEQVEKNNSPKNHQTAEDDHKTGDLNSEKIESIEQNLKAIEDRIIEDTIKYAGAHEASSYPEDVETLKNHVVSKLATAYSLEKIRRTLDHLKQTRERNGHLEENLISELDGPTRGKHPIEASEKEKRVAVKKEKVEFDNHQHTIDSATDGNENKVVDPLHNNHFEENVSNSHDDDDDAKNKKRKRNGGHSFLDLNDKSEDDDVERDLGRHYGHSSINAYGNRYDHPFRGANNDIMNDCPILNAIDKRCQNVDLITNGGMVSEFTDAILPACGVHQFCYLCGTSLTFCDFQYLSETDVICGSNKECQSTAHFILMILRDSTTGPQQIGPKECAKNPCLFDAMKNAAGY